MRGRRLQLLDQTGDAALAGIRSGGVRPHFCIVCNRSANVDDTGWRNPECHAMTVSKSLSVRHGTSPAEEVATWVMPLLCLTLVCHSPIVLGEREKLLCSPAFDTRDAETRSECSGSASGSTVIP